MCVSDQHGGFELHATEDVDRQNRLLEQLKCLRTSQTQSDLKPAEDPSRVSFTPLLDIPVDSFSHPESLKPTRSSPTIPNWLLTQNSPSPPNTDDVSHLEPHSENATSRRGRSPFRNGRSESKASKKDKAARDDFFTVVDTPRHRRPPLSQVFGPLRRSPSSAAPSVGHNTENQAQEHPNDPEYELKTVCISKTKHSLGEKPAVCSSSASGINQCVMLL